MKKMSFLIILCLLASSVKLTFGNEPRNHIPANNVVLANEQPANCYPSHSSFCGCRGSINLEILYLRASEDCIEDCRPILITDSFPPTSPKIVSTFEGLDEDFNFKWNVGFRLGLGYAVESQKYDFFAQWTHLNATGSLDKFLHWKLYYDVVDAGLLFNIHLTCDAMLRPFIAIEGINFNQYLKQGELPFPFPIDANEILLFKDDKQRTSVVGPLLGVELDWNMGWGFSFYSSASASCLYGVTNVTLNHAEETLQTIDFFTLEKKLHPTLIGQHTSFGLRLHLYACGNMESIFQVGLEHHCYYNFNRLIDCSGNLNIDGINMAFEIEF